MLLLNQVFLARNHPPVTAPLTRFCCVALQKSTKSGKVLLGELDVSVLTDQSLRDELLSHGLDAGPIVGEY